VCASTIIASGALRALNDRGLSCPKQVSLIAHDDALPSLRAIDFEPALTVTRSPLREACKPIVEQLLSLLKGEQATSQQTVAKAELIVRRSTALPPIH